MDDPLGTRFDAETLQKVAAGFEAVLGRDQVAEALRSRAASGPDAPALDLLEGFRLLDDWLAHLRVPREPPNVQLMLRFAVTAQIVTRCAEMKDSTSWQEKLRAHALLPDPEPFYNALFEGEFATYWADYVAEQHDGASFGPPSGHPDVWLSLATNRGPVTIPGECKRIAPRGEKDRAQEAFAALLEKRVRSLSAEHYPFKVVIWLHDHVSADDAPTVASLVEKLVPLARDHGRWVTAFDGDGLTQVSLCALGAAGEFQASTISVTDIEAKGHLACSLEIIHGVKHRTKYILGVRSDVQSDRLGSLRKHFLKAAREQLPRAGNGMPGIVALRIRPPRQIGDLLEADEVVRAAMVERGTEHAAMAVLLWNEDDRREEAIEHEGQPGSDKMIAYRLRPYFIPHPRSRVRMGLDSYTEFFGKRRAGLRDPLDGSLKPIDAETMKLLRDGGELPPMLKAANSDLVDLDEEDGATTLYVKLDRPAGTITEEMFLGYFFAGARQFRRFVDPNRHLRTIEISEGAPRRVCTVDLRAWSENTELLVVTKWSSDSFAVGLQSPDGSERFWARSVLVSQPDAQESEPVGPAAA